MKWTISGWQLKQWLLCAFMLCFLLQPLRGFSWTIDKWLGVIEASAGAVTATAVSPDVTPSNGECENCNGTGKVGDGTVFVICPVCDGTGKIGEGDSAANTAAPFQVCTAFR